MALEHIQTFLVHPSRGEAEPSPIGGTNVPLEGKVFELIRDIYDTSDRECRIEISFNNRPDGEATNPCRTLLCTYASAPSVETGRALAERLASVTTRRSGMGLLFLAKGTEDSRQKSIIARFPANHGILAEEARQTLTVEFLERVFMRSATAYKAVVYEDSSIADGFWTGRAVDRQINSREIEVSHYWINEFLDSDFRTTSAAGTRRLAIAMRDAARKSPSLQERQEITAAAMLGQGIDGQMLTAEGFMDRFGMSEATRVRVLSEMRSMELANERFRFSAEEFKRQVPYKSVELDSGAVLTADAETFDDIFEQVPLGRGETRFSTTGQVVAEKLEKTK